MSFEATTEASCDAILDSTATSAGLVDSTISTAADFDGVGSADFLLLLLACQNIQNTTEKKKRVNIKK
jgi:hypothetical protein